MKKVHTMSLQKDKEYQRDTVVTGSSRRMASISSEVDHLIKSTIDKFKFINILVNNAGIVFVKKSIDRRMR
jgi:NAD(P)-dependent dehydrogenase (short-subunit alcohol dehydrogenase family)